MLRYRYSLMSLCKNCITSVLVICSLFPDNAHPSTLSPDAIGKGCVTIRVAHRTKWTTQNFYKVRALADDFLVVYQPCKDCKCQHAPHRCLVHTDFDCLHLLHQAFQCINLANNCCFLFLMILLLATKNCEPIDVLSLEVSVCACECVGEVQSMQIHHGHGA